MFLAIVIVPLSYMSYALLPYSEQRPIHLLSHRQQCILRFFCFYPLVALPVIMLAVLLLQSVLLSLLPEIKAGYVLVFCIVQVLAGIIAAGISIYVLAASKWQQVIFILNIVASILYGYVFIALVLES